jgi:heme oxygenase
MVAAAAAATKMPPSARGEDGEKTFVEEMKDIAMSLHTEDQARTVNLRNATVEGYLRFLVDSKLVFETLENIVNRAVVPFPWCE